MEPASAASPDAAGRDGPRSMIDISGVSKVYQMGSREVDALDGVSLNIAENEYIAIMGPSGSGKSTMMNVLGCLDTPTSGTYFLNGENVGEMTEDELAAVRNREIGFIFQTFNLLPRVTCVQNAELPLIYGGVSRAERRERAREVLREVGLGERLGHRPNELSGGQRQRVAVARALVSRPSIILADEPTGNLDTATGDEIMRLFESLYRRGNTLIVVTHEPPIANHARRIIHLRDGRIEREETVDDPVLAGANLDALEGSHRSEAGRA